MSRPIIALTVSLFAAVVYGASGQEQYAGTWQAKYKDRVFCTIGLKTAGKEISGTMRECRVRVNSDGDISDPGEQEGPANPVPILDPKLDGDTLRFESKDTDGDEHIHFEMQFSGENRADLRFIGAPLKIKPIHFEKNRSSTRAQIEKPRNEQHR